MSDAAPPPPPDHEPKIGVAREMPPNEAARARLDAEASRLNASIKRSAIFHAILAILTLIPAILLPSMHKPVALQSAVRVDLVGLPDYTKKEMANAEPADFADISKKLDKAKEKTDRDLEALKKMAKEKPPADDEMVLKKKKAGSKKENRKDSMKSALDRIKSLERVEESLKQHNNKVVAKGNVVSQGNTLTGNTQGDFNEYAEKMRSKLVPNWDLPAWLLKQDLSAKLVVYLDRFGYVQNMAFQKSSGNKQFDDYVLKTVKASQPFGAPPELMQRNGILLGFPL